MIDLHSHILPGMDDGAIDVFDTIEMVRVAADSGITAMAATPHCDHPCGYANYYGKEYIDGLQQVREAVGNASLDVQILPGAEVFVSEDLPELLCSGKIMTLNQSRYLLVEFDFDEDPDFACFMLEKIRKISAIPVIAHAERYRFVQKEPQVVYEWRKMGYPIQINKGSFQGRYGRKEAETAYLLMDHDLVSVIASDAHGPYIRTPYMREVYGELLERYSKEYLRMLFGVNPGRICHDLPILGYRAKRIE